MKTILGIVLIAACVLCGISQAYAADPVALVTDLEGNATLRDGGKSGRLSVLAYLVPGAEIVLETGSRMVVTFFAHPNEYTFVGPATVSIQEEVAKVLKGRAPEPRRLAEEKAVAARKFVRLQRERTAMATFEMRGPLRSELRLLAPVNTEIVSNTPKFSWTTLPGIDRYHLTLREPGGRMLMETTVEGGDFQLPADTPLRYGSNYSWKVDGKLPSGKTVWASGDFVLVDDERVRQINAVRPSADAPFSDRLLFAVFLETEGLEFDAHSEWHKLVLERPDDASLRRWAEP